MADDNDDGRDNDEKKVGYGKPPKHGQFKPGKSGNPRGRPKGALGLKAELKAELDEFVTITVDGKPKRIRKRRLVIKALAAKAAKGNVAAADKLLSLVIQAEGFEDERPVQKALTDTDNLILSQFLGDGEGAPIPEPETDPEVDPDPVNHAKSEESE